MTDDAVRGLLLKMPAEWAMRWCPGGICACIGAANCSGGLAKLGVTEEQYRRANAGIIYSAHVNDPEKW